MNGILVRQLEHLKNKYNQLLDNCSRVVEKEIPHAILADTGTLLNDIVRASDVLMSEYFRQKVAPSLSQPEVSRYERKVLFPDNIQNEKELIDDLKKMKCDGILTSDLAFYSFLKSFVLGIGGAKFSLVKDYSNKTHRVVLSQKKFTVSYIQIGNVVRIHEGVKNFEMNNCLVNGMPVTLRIQDGKMQGEVDKRLPVTRSMEQSFVFEDTSVNVLGCLHDGLASLEEMHNGFEQFIN